MNDITQAEIILSIKSASESHIEAADKLREVSEHITQEQLILIRDAECTLWSILDGITEGY